MKLRTIFVAALFFCAACNNSNDQEPGANTGKDTATDDTYVSTTPIPLDGCYRMNYERDTATMRLNVVDSFVTGDLYYKTYEKDHNDGTIRGVVRDSLIIANYTFRSEGMMSVRQVVFKMAGTSLVEGYGDLNTAGDTVKFKNIDQLRFLNDRPFNKVPCDQ